MRTCPKSPIRLPLWPIDAQRPQRRTPASRPLNPVKSLVSSADEPCRDRSKIAGALSYGLRYDQRGKRRRGGGDFRYPGRSANREVGKP